MTENLYEEVESLYSLICSRAMIIEKPLALQYAINKIQKLEELTHSNFTDTEDMHIKIRAFLSGKEKPHIKLKKYRRSCGHSQVHMAKILGVTTRHYIRMEKGYNSLNTKALNLIYGKE